MAQKNGYFQISCKNDGTWVTLFPPKNDGEKLKFEMLDAFLAKWKIEYDKKQVADALSALTEPKELRLTTVCTIPMNESSLVKISEDCMTCVIVLFMPAVGGKLMTEEEIIGDLVHAGVKYGLDKERLAQLGKEREYCTPIVLAKATPPVEGTNAKITYHFNTDLSMKPKVLEDGSVDFHSLNTICSVHAGDLLAELMPAVPGRPGIDVCGRQIKPMKVNQLVLRHANRIHLSEDGLKMYSDVDGHVNLVEGKVFVSDTYTIPADVDSSTGDITCEGNVEVKGNVRTGFKITAKGDVIVEGVVEGAEIYAGGQIILTRGIQGMSRGKLVAEGNIIAKFIESAEVTSKFGYVQAEAIMHSNVSARTDVLVDGKKGFITGGNTRCGQLISAKTIGSNMGTTTFLEVGIDPAVIEEYRRLEKSMPELSAEKDNTMKMLAGYAKKIKQGEQLAMDKLLWIKQAKKRIEEIDAELLHADERMLELEELMEMKGNGCVKVSQTAYAGCKITIAGAIYHIKSDLSHLRFIKENGDVKIASF